MKTFIAIDIGASSGRLMKSSFTEGKISLEEVHRFKNSFEKSAGHLRWNIQSLITEILKGMEKLKQNGVTDCYVGVDTWAVDYCLVDEKGKLLANPVAYRDSRTDNAVADFEKKMSLETLYEKTGIQIQTFNTIFQLLVEDKTLLEKASNLLLIPDYLGYVFTGKMVTEKTNASTMQLLNGNTKDWDEELLQILGLQVDFFPELVEAGEILGDLQIENFPTFDLPNATFITVASHDTASAIIGTPGCGEKWGYLSSGTWSLLGVETLVPNLNRDAFYENYTNEWGAHNTIRFLKNIMGMWLIQEMARIQDYAYSYVELVELASREKPFQQFIDVNDISFLNPTNMIDEIQTYCLRTNQMVPETPGEIARCIYDNLALCYALELEKLTKLTTTDCIRTLHIVGGGSNNELLNQLTANTTQVTVEAGPSEATAIGNILLQMVTIGIFKSIEEARSCISDSFDCKVYQPKENYQTVVKDYKKFLKGER